MLNRNESRNSAAFGDTSPRERGRSQLLTENAAVPAPDRLGAALLNSLPCHAVLLDRAGRITAVNDAWTAFARANGGSVDGLSVGADYLAVCRGAGEDPGAGEALRGIMEVMRGERDRFTLEYPCHSPTEDRWFLMSVTRPAEVGGGVIIAHLDITAQKRGEQALRRGKELSEAVNRISQALHSTLDPDEVLRRIVLEGVKALGSDTAALAERAEGGWWPRYVHGIAQDLVGQRLDDDTESHAVLALQTGDVVPVVDAFHDERFNREHLRRYNVRSVLVAPLFICGKPFGAVFFNYHHGAHAFTEEEINFARQLAAAAASALQNARLFAERKLTEAAVQRSRDRQELLARTISALLTAPDPQSVIQGLCDEVRRFLDCAVFFNFLLEPERRRLRLNACGGAPPRLARKVEDLELGASLCGSAARDACRVLAENLPATLDPRATLVRNLGVRAYACHPLPGPAGRVLGTLSFGATNRDRFTADDLDLMKTVTDHVAVAMLRREAEEALREAGQRLEYHIQNTPLAVIEFDASLRVRAWSDGAQRVFGWAAPEVIGRSVWDIPWIFEEDRAQLEAMSAELVSGQSLRSSGAIRNLRKDGLVIWCEWYHSSLTDPGGKVQSLQSLVLDVTARKEAEAVLARDREELERLVRERTARLQELVNELEHFSYTITHDMRAPLRAMRGYGELVMDLCAESAHPEQKEFLRKIMVAAERMDGLITDALSYSRAVRQELPLTTVDTGALLRGMLDSYPELQASRAHIEIQGALPIVLGNEAGLTQCFSNLLGNAVKFVKPGETPDIRIWAEVQGERVRIWVEDRGIGIAQDVLPRVFDMFSRGSHACEGTGIGLALVRKVAHRMGGRVGVQSEEGEGSRFWLELSLGQHATEATAALFMNDSWRGETVLYVEDEENDALFMQRAFAGAGIARALRRVSHGRAAIDYLLGIGIYANREAFPVPAVVLLDINLPLVSGFDVLKWIRARPEYAALPVLMFSSSRRCEDEHQARELGANALLEKPDSGSRFRDIVEQLRGTWLRSGPANARRPASRA